MTTTNNSRLVQPYVFFEGHCEEAIEYYKKILGAEVEMLMRFKESPEPLPPGCIPPGAENKVMHARIRIGQTILLMGDARCSGKPVFQGFFLSLSVGTETEVDQIIAALGEGGKVQTPPYKTFFSPRFGMVTDRFGIGWMLLVPRPQ